MKILMLCDFFNEDLDYQESLQARYYSKYHGQVTVVTSTCKSAFDYNARRISNAKSSHTYFFNQVKIHRQKYQLNLLNQLRWLEGVADILESEAPDLIFVHAVIPDLLVAIKHKIRHPNCDIVLGSHADYSNSASNWLSRRILHGWLRRYIIVRAKPHLRQIFSVTPASTKFLNEIYGIPLSEIELLPLGADVDLGRQVQSQNMGESLRRHHRIADSDIVIFTGGKLTPAKKTEILIEAVTLLGRNFHLFLVGDSDDSDASYKEGLIRLSLNNSNVHLVGWKSREEVFQYLDMADLAVFPASQSILWQQAISMDLPLIVGNTGSQDISYLNDGNIVMLKREDISPERISSEIREIVGSTDRLESMRLKARAVTDELLDWNKLIGRTLF